MIAKVVNGAKSTRGRQTKGLAELFKPFLWAKNKSESVIILIEAKQQVLYITIN